jgi:hypothetical protein
MTLSPNENPYAPSMNLEQPVSQAGKLFSPGQVALASFLGMPLAGCFLIAHNCKTLGQVKLVSKVWSIGTAVSVGTMVLSMFVPDNFPSLPIPIALTIGSFYYAKSLHGEDYERHILSGGQRASTWAAAGFGVLGLIICLVLVFGILFLLPENWWMEIEG